MSVTSSVPKYHGTFGKESMRLGWFWICEGVQKNKAEKTSFYPKKNSPAPFSPFCPWNSSERPENLEDL